MSDFVHLHVHSHYSLLDALPKIDELVDHAKKLGYKSLALTDHGNMYGTIEFYEACQKAGIKPIVGMEAYLVAGSRFDKNNRDEKIYHQVLLALDNVGYKNLMKLASLASLEGFSDKPRLDKELLRQYTQYVFLKSNHSYVMRIEFTTKNPKFEIETPIFLFPIKKNCAIYCYYLNLVDDCEGINNLIGLSKSQIPTSSNITLEKLIRDIKQARQNGLLTPAFEELISKYEI